MNAFLAGTLMVAILPSFVFAGETTITAQADAVLTGVVTHLSDVPLSGALVTLHAQTDTTTTTRGADTPDALAHILTDHNGTFCLVTTYHGTAVVAAHSDLYDQPTTATIKLERRDTSTVALRFEPRHSFSAYVTESGNAVSSATVVIYWTDVGRQRQRVLQTRPDGRALFEGVPAIALDKLEVRSPEHQRFVSTDAIPLPAHEYPVWLHRRPSIEVEVANPNPAIESRPILVSLLRVNKDSSAGSTPGSGESRRVQRQNAENGITLFPYVEPGWYKAVAQHADAWAESEPALAAKDGGVTRIAVSLEQNATVQGRVIDKATRSPIADATIDLSPADADLPKVSRFTTHTDSDGKFTIDSVPRGTMKLHARHPEYSPHTKIVSATALGKKPVEIALSTDRPTLAGTIKHDSMPLPGALIVLYKAGEAEVPAATAMSNSEGEYDAGAQDPGNYTAMVEAPVGSSDAITRKSYSVVLEDKPVRLDMTFARPVHVTGRVIWQKKPQPPPNANKMLLFTRIAGGNTSVLVPLQGEAQFEATLEPGLYSVGLEDSPGTEVKIPDTNGAEILVEL